MIKKRHMADKYKFLGEGGSGEHTTPGGTTKISERVISLLSHAKHYMNYTFPCYETKVALLFQSKLSLIVAKDKSKQFHSLIKL